MGLTLRPNATIMMNTERLVASTLESRRSLLLAVWHSWLDIKHFCVVDGNGDDEASLRDCFLGGDESGVNSYSTHCAEARRVVLE